MWQQNKQQELITTITVSVPLQGPCQAEGETCRQPCHKKRANCSHLCMTRCHADNPCPSIPCKAEVSYLSIVVSLLRGQSSFLSLCMFISKYLLYIITSASVHPSPSFLLSLFHSYHDASKRSPLSLFLFLVTLLHKTFDNHDKNKINHEIYWQRIISDYVVDINHVLQPTVYAELKISFCTN